MEVLGFDALMVLLALFLVALNGLFVAAEFGFVKIRATQVERLVQEGRATAGLVKDATRRLDAYLSVCQLGITISSLGLGWIGEPAFAHLLEPLLEPLGVPEGSTHLITPARL
jgi:CBS domain containing-hemolysin-like protein